MVEVKPKKDAIWDKERYGPIHEKWIRFYVFFKAKNQNEYEEYRKEILLSIKRITETLNNKEMLESFHFLGEPFPQEFEYGTKYFSKMLDVRVWIKKREDTDIAKNIIRDELNRENNNAIIDFGFWHFPLEQRNYCKDAESRLYYSIICRIYEYYCKFLFEKLDPKSTKSIWIDELKSDGTKNIRPSDFSNWKIIHCFLNIQGMNPIDEAGFTTFYTLERMGNFNQAMANKYYFFPLQIEDIIIADGKEIIFKPIQDDKVLHYKTIDGKEIFRIITGYWQESTSLSYPSNRENKVNHAQ